MLAFVWLRLGAARIRNDSVALCILLVNVMLAAHLEILEGAIELSLILMTVLAKDVRAPVAIEGSIVFTDASWNAAQSAMTPCSRRCLILRWTAIRLT